MATFQGTIWEPKAILFMKNCDIKRDLAVLQKLQVEKNLEVSYL